jgi:hypothetical protein
VRTKELALFKGKKKDYDFARSAHDFRYLNVFVDLIDFYEPRTNKHK